MTDHRSIAADIETAARAIRGSSWPGEMAQQMEDRANRLLGFAAKLTSEPDTGDLLAHIADVAPEDCIVEGHWFDSIVTGNPEDHDGGLPDDASSPCSTTVRWSTCPTCGFDGNRL